mmetsp:Transcript_49472/g.165197  ORF Transcript_49472/g.165197 Transcript_49472/m.165197 type:complete len:130 (-) Transcript_49472:92-481(-)
MLRSRAEPPTRPDAGGCLADRCRNGPANLTRITISNSSFQDAFLPGALLVEANARGVDFSGALLPNADFRHAHVDGSSFRGARITDAVFSWSHLNATDFTDAVGVGKALWTGFRGTPVGLPPGLQSLWR